MLERTDSGGVFCNVCSHETAVEGERRPTRNEKRFTSLDDLVARTGLRRDELVTLADIGALDAFGYDRRSALWQVGCAVRPSGELFETIETADTDACPPRPMTQSEPLVADCAGAGLAGGPL